MLSNGRDKKAAKKPARPLAQHLVEISFLPHPLLTRASVT